MNRHFIDTIPGPRPRNPELANDKEYQAIIELVESLWEEGVIIRGQGHCISMSDLIHTLLSQKGIKSTLVECKVTVLNDDPPELKLIGHEQQSLGLDGSKINTHVICITQTKVPLLIDLSIGHVIKRVPYIVEPLTGSKNQIIAEYHIDQSHWTYQIKNESSIPAYHQLSILDRIKTDRQLFSSIRFLQIVLVIALTVSSLNAIRGFFDFYQVYINDDNYWGPTQMEQLVKKIDRIEEQLNKK